MRGCVARHITRGKASEDCRVGAVEQGDEDMFVTTFSGLVQGRAAVNVNGRQAGPNRFDGAVGHRDDDIRSSVKGCHARQERALQVRPVWQRRPTTVVCHQPAQLRHPRERSLLMRIRKVLALFDLIDQCFDAHGHSSISKKEAVSRWTTGIGRK
jgi:hypothetical protein